MPMRHERRGSTLSTACRSAKLRISADCAYAKDTVLRGLPENLHFVGAIRPMRCSPRCHGRGSEANGASPRPQGRATEGVASREVAEAATLSARSQGVVTGNDDDPVVAVTMPQTLLMSVVLPAPLGASTSTISPLRVSTSTLFSATRSGA